MSEQWKTLQHEWQRASEQWDDPAQKQFAGAFWQECERIIPPAMKELQGFIELVERAQRELDRQ